LSAIWHWIRLLLYVFTFQFFRQTFSVPAALFCLSEPGENGVSRPQYSGQLHFPGLSIMAFVFRTSDLCSFLVMT
jgi:hypothetical protein